ncbi:MAG: hypothetical protein NC347_03950 [Clostridium sp.]|nr:hypothetical protein [Clostridium sp.]
MLKLLTDCDKCIHGKVCKNKDNPKDAMGKLTNTTYGDGPNDDYGWDVMMKSQNVDVSFSCPDYQERKPTPKGFA